jgi:hypothetical protein
LTRASWHDHVEIWSYIPQRNSRRTSFDSIKQLREHVDVFIEADDQDATQVGRAKHEIQLRVAGCLQVVAREVTIS